MRRPILAVAVLLVGSALLVPPSQAAKGERGKGRPSPSPTATVTPTPTPTASATPTATPSPTPTPSPTTASPTPTPSATPTPSPTRTADVYVTPSAGYREALLLTEGALVEIASDVTNFTAAQVAVVLRANAYQLDLIGPTLTVRVQTKYNSISSTSAGTGPSGWEFFSAIMFLDARAASSFTSYPHKIAAHEYGHVWSYFHYFLTKQGAGWGEYHAARGITGDPRLETSYLWQTAELIADDYRLLLGSLEAIAGGAYLLYQLPDPRTVPGLREFLASGWTSPA